MLQRLQLAEQNRVTPLPFDGKQFNPCAGHRQLLPANRVVCVQEVKAGKAGNGDARRLSGRLVHQAGPCFDAAQDFVLEFARWSHEGSGHCEQRGGLLQGENEIAQFGAAAQLRAERLLFGAGQRPQHVEAGLFLLLFGDHT